MARGMRLDYITRHRVDVRGWRAKDLIIQATNKRPVWSNVAKAWVVSQDSAADLIALCDQRNIPVETTGAVPKVDWPAVDEEDQEPRCHDTSASQEALW